MNQMNHPSGVADSSQQEQSSASSTFVSSSSTSSQQQQQQHQQSHHHSSITILPDHVVARIAAGEVVQRPVSVIKELLENSLDAHATEIVVTISSTGGTTACQTEMSISDNGIGMSPQDLPLAVLRHATSKLSSVDDLQRLDTFGFRGEALSSVSMVALKLVICSRQQKPSPSSSSSSSSSSVAYTMSFRDGKPLLESSSSSATTITTPVVATTPQPTARRVGTTVTVYDLFYNLPLRKNNASNASSDYNAILHVIQAYAICVAERGIGLICQKKKQSKAGGGNNTNTTGAGSRSSSRNMPNTIIDWNSSMGAVAKLRTALQQQQSSNNNNNNNNALGHLLELQQHQATKHVIAMIHGSRIQSHLQHFAWTAPAASSSLPNNNNNNNNNKDDSSTSDAVCASPFLYQCKGYLALPSFYFQDKNNNDSTNGGGGGGVNKNKKARKNTASSSNSNITTLTNASSRFILFINQRLVECKPLTRAVEDTYTAFSPMNKRVPFCYLHLTVPAHQVDVNVHPSKKLVTLLYLNDICQHLAAQFRQLLQNAGQAFCQASSSSSFSSDNHPPFSATTTAKTTSMSQSCLKPLQQQQQQDNKRPSLAWGEKVQQIQNPYQPKNKRQRTSSIGENSTTATRTDKQEENDTAPSGKSTTRSSSSSSGKQDDSSSPSNPMDDDAPPKTSTAPKQPRKKTPASQLIRTSRSSSQVGALEPFLVTKASLLLSQQSSTSSTATTATTTSPQQQQQHNFDCPLAKRYNKDSNNANDGASLSSSSSSSPLLSAMDLSQPGAFAILASQCKCVNRHLSSSSPLPTNPAATSSTNNNNNNMIRLPSQALVRPQAVVATTCEYKSIRKLRLEIQQKACPELQSQLRSACFVGVVSRERSLLQVGQELILLNHYEAARELFYQLALLQFKGGARMANLGNHNKEGHNGDDSSGCQAGGGIDIVTVLADLVETEDILGRLWHEDDDNVVKKTMATLMNTAGPLRNVSETNRALAEQAAACLLEEAELLQEYFSIRIERQQQTEDKQGRRQDGKGRIVLSGMPVLLEGYTPAPHGLSLFLLRLATEVNWKDERQCFHDICRELGAFYATLPLSSLASCSGGDGRSADDVSHYLLPHVRHTIFPAISFLLIPPQSLQTNGHWKTLSALPKLYKVFERC